MKQSTGAKFLDTSEKDVATALITGAGRRIGRAIATALAADGWQVIIHYNRSSEEADKLVDEIEEKGGRAGAVRCDLSDASAVEGARRRVRRAVRAARRAHQQRLALRIRRHPVADPRILGRAYADQSGGAGVSVSGLRARAGSGPQRRYRQHHRSTRAPAGARFPVLYPVEVSAQRRNGGARPGARAAHSRQRRRPGTGPTEHSPDPRRLRRRKSPAHCYSGPAHRKRLPTPSGSSSPPRR